MKNAKKVKALATLAASALVVGCVVGGTLAWLTDTTDPVTNTFTTSNIDIDLTETTGGDRKEYKMVPGYTIEKDPTVTVEAGSEACYLFVKVEESENFDTYLSYKMADGWTALDDVDNVYYREVVASEDNANFSVLKNNEVHVSDEVTQDQMASLSDDNYPTLTFTAYASQLYKDANEKFAPAEAWNNVNPDTQG